MRSSKKVKDNGKCPFDVIDYEVADRYETGLYNYEFHPVFTLRPGSNEGYYLSLYKAVIRDNLTRKESTLQR